AARLGSVAAIEQLSVWGGGKSRRIGGPHPTLPRRRGRARSDSTPCSLPQAGLEAMRRLAPSRRRGLGAMRRLAPSPRAGESKRYVALLPPAGGRTRSDTSSCPSPHAEDSKRYVVLPPPPPAGEGWGGGRAGATQPASH